MSKIYILVAGLPATASMYFVLSLILGQHYAFYVLGCFAVVQTILGIYLYVMSNRYDGQMVVGDKEDGGKLFSLELNDDPEPLQNKESVSFRVIKSSE